MNIYPPIGHPAFTIALQGARSVYITADQYLFNVLRREAVTTTNSPLQPILNVLRPPIMLWANKYLSGIVPSGSFAKGTAIKSGTDIDLFISLKPETTASLKEIYESLFERMHESGYSPQRQNVSISVRVAGFSVDLVPGKRQSNLSTDHSLYRRRADTWTQTNVSKHIAYVKAGSRLNETRVLKLWRNQKKLDFPSFYLEMTVIDALRGVRAQNTLSANVTTILEYFRDKFPNTRVVDPANTKNIISDDLNVAERATIKAAAAKALQGTWAELVS